MVVFWPDEPLELLWPADDDTGLLGDVLLPALDVELDDLDPLELGAGGFGVVDLDPLLLAV